MASIFNRIALIGVIRRRIFSHLKLILTVWAGFTLAVALVISIPVYAEASGYRILLAALAEQSAQDHLPPFSFVYTYGGASTPRSAGQATSRPISWPAIWPLPGSSCLCNIACATPRPKA